VKFQASFPLILTFSPGEKEQQLSIFISAIINRAADRAQLAKTLETIPPLPKGEGRGEGKRSLQMNHGV
jgi:hypothetical protein